MGIVNGGVGGAAFNGGTITQPLLIDLSAAAGNTIPLRVKASFAAQGEDFFDVVDSDSGTTFLSVDPAGNTAMHREPDDATTAFVKKSLITTCVGGIYTSAIASGALPTVSPVSGTGVQLMPTFATTRDVHFVCPVTFNPTAGAAATCLVELSPDNVTYSTVGVATEPVGVALAGTIQLVSVTVPGLWYVKLTATNAVLGTGTYY